MQRFDFTLLKKTDQHRKFILRPFHFLKIDCFIQSCMHGKRAHRCRRVQQQHEMMYPDLQNISGLEGRGPKGDPAAAIQGRKMTAKRNIFHYELHLLGLGPLSGKGLQYFDKDSYFPLQLPIQDMTESPAGQMTCGLHPIQGRGIFFRVLAPGTPPVYDLPAQQIFLKMIRTKCLAFRECLLFITTAYPYPLFKKKTDRMIPESDQIPEFHLRTGLSLRQGAVKKSGSHSCRRNRSGQPFRGITGCLRIAVETLSAERLQGDIPQSVSRRLTVGRSRTSLD